MSKSWTVDTNVLYACEDFQSDATALLNGILSGKHSLYCCREIFQEYDRCLKSAISPICKRFLESWLKNLHKQKLIIFIDHECEQKEDIISKLKELNFHNDDHKFVLVCYKSPNKLLVSVDSDYTKEVLEYLKSELDITHLDLNFARQYVETDFT